MAENVRYELPAALLERYRQLVSGVSEMTAQVVWAQIQTAKPKTRRELEAIVANALRSGDSEMSEIDRQYYESARRYITGEESWGSGLLTDEEWAGSFDRAIDAMIREYGEYDPETGWYEIREEDWARFESDMNQFVHRVLNESSKHYVEVYGSRDYRKPKYARVPSGAETCAWCWSLAGLGFQYKSAESASHSHANCVVEGTEVFGRGLLAGLRREYKGALVDIATAKGRKLTVTPNHPILTVSGWKRADELVEGDNLICAAFSHGHVGRVPDIDDAPPVVEEVFEAACLVDAAFFDGMPTAAKNLYREMFPDCDVEVVDPCGLLHRAFEAAISKPSEHRSLAAAELFCSAGSVPLDGKGAQNLLVDRGFPATGCVMGCAGLRCPFGWCHCGDPKQSSFGAAAMFKSGVAHPSVDDVSGNAEPACDGVDAFSALERFEGVCVIGDDLLARLDSLALQEPVDGLPANGEAIANLAYGSAGQIEVDDVVSLSIREGECHVYNLSTEGGWYVSSGIITHNCDCVIVPSWDESGVEGYDSEYYANLFRDARSWLNSAEAPEELKRRVYETALAHTDGSYQSIRNFERWNGVLMAMRWRDGLK